MKSMQGILEYQGKEYFFSLEDYELSMWERKDMHNGAFFLPMADVIQAVMDHVCIPVIWGNCFPDGHKIALLDVHYTGFKNNVQKLSVDQYIEYYHKYTDKTSVCGISFAVEELNSIFPVTDAYAYDYNKTSDYNNAITVNKKLISDDWEFVCDGNDVSAVCYYTQRFLHDKHPLRIESVFRLSFQETDDYEFLAKLIRVGKQFIQYLCNRQNIKINHIEVFSLGENGRSTENGSFSAAWINEIHPEEEKDIPRHCIRIDQVSRNAGALLQQIADNQIYTWHIPESNLDSRRFTASKVLMLTSAFEWEYKRIYLNGKSNKKISLQTKLKEALDDHELCIRENAQLLFANNKLQYCSDDVAACIVKIRNKIVHGDPQITFETETVISVMVLPYLLNAMQLRYVGFNDDEIQKVQRKLFRNM